MTSFRATTSARDPAAARDDASLQASRPDHVGGFLTVLPGLIGIALVAYAYLAGGYITSVVSFGLIYALFVTGLNLFMGYTGQVSFGQNAFAAISGYASINGDEARTFDTGRPEGFDRVPVDAFVDLPASGELALWFHATNIGGCSQYDSNNSQNYRFEILP